MGTKESKEVRGVRATGGNLAATPGPWEVDWELHEGVGDADGQPPRFPYAIRSLEQKDARGNASSVCFPEACRSEDATLIAAAPELYAALEDVASDFASLLNSDYETQANPFPSDAQPSLVRARAALAKARGE